MNSFFPYPRDTVRVLSRPECFRSHLDLQFLYLFICEDHFVTCLYKNLLSLDLITFDADLEMRFGLLFTAKLSERVFLRQPIVTELFRLVSVEGMVVSISLHARRPSVWSRHTTGERALRDETKQRPSKETTASVTPMQFIFASNCSDTSGYRS